VLGVHTEFNDWDWDIGISEFENVVRESCGGRGRVLTTLVVAYI
jgi:hypothetical protein